MPPSCYSTTVKVRVVDGNLETANMLLVTTFVKLRVVAGRSRTRAGRPHAVSGRPMLIHTHHAVMCRGLERSLSERHCRGIACVNQTRPHCVNKMGKAQSKPLAERHDMCELAFTRPALTQRLGRTQPTRSSNPRSASGVLRCKIILLIYS
jgi:hypothetical protein